MEELLWRFKIFGIEVGWARYRRFNWSTILRDNREKANYFSGWMNLKNIFSFFSLF